MTEADRFAAEYAALRSREPWTQRERARRAAAIAGAVALIRAELGPNAVIIDIGAGTAAAPGVIAVDIVPPQPPAGLALRGDMLHLPIAGGAADAALYAASLHYAPIEAAIAEAARIVRAGGLIAALDSPIYRGAAAAEAAKARSAAYYARAGHPALASHYHPVELAALRGALERNGFEVTRLSTGSRWRRLRRRGPDSFVLARRLR